MPIYNEDQDKMLCESLMSKKEFEKLKARMCLESHTRMIFLANYMCKAVQDDENLIFPHKSIKTYKAIPEDEGWIFAVADTADEGLDFFAMPIFKIIGNKVYLIDCIFDQNNLTIQEDQVVSKAKEHNIRKILVETNSAGAYFKRRLQSLLDNIEVYGQYSKANKISRILSYSGIIKNHFLFPENPTPIVSKFINRVFGIMKTSKKDDDAPDALAIGAAHLEIHYNLFE
jgi:predicted phage terminase large subunit-like protein